jgi:hypothetical protein
MAAGSSPTSRSARATVSRRSAGDKAALLDEKALLDDLRDGQAGGEGAVGVLEDHLHVLAQGTDVARAQAVDAAAEDHDRPLGGEQAQHGEAEGGLAGAGFADDADRLALADPDGHAVDGFHVARSCGAGNRA